MAIVTSADYHAKRDYYRDRHREAEKERLIPRKGDRRLAQAGDQEGALHRIASRLVNWGSILRGQARTAARAPISQPAPDPVS